MRVKDNINAKGHFWLPNSPDVQVSGTLFIAEGGRIELEIVGSFDEKDNGFIGYREDDYHFPRIVCWSSRKLWHGHS